MKNYSKLLTIGTLITISLFITACGSGVSQEQYNALNTEKENLQSDYDKLKNDYEKIKVDYTSLLDEKAESILDDAPLQYATAWAKTSYGENVECSSSADSLNVLVHTDISVTSENVTDIINKFISSMKYYKIAYETTPDNLNFKFISVNYLDLDDNAFLSLTIVKTDDTFELNKILVDATQTDTIISGLSSNN
ncbi:hypothetical protein [Lachnotalea glycerini]|uniref:Lipoprotein n=1 Tax=Lachnotalea glycerini TaxID=1763509 RepID=A0A371J410_9FIRM|nr:hypothetical protein [Lachnotalea glycerini]RDY27509.1 hypothetical protein CG710_020550 [Lachnotalea glycerini]